MTGNSSDSPNEDALVGAFAESWESYWASLLNEQPARKENRVRARLERLLKRSGSAELICDIVSSELRMYSGDKILEAGCGTGHVSFHLAPKGGKHFLLDTSPSALKFTRKQAASLGLPAVLLKASILALPFRDEVFDGCFNVGVVDHFGPHRRADAVKEMLRVTHPESPVVVVTNSSRSKIHAAAMRYARKKGTWPYGFKAAVSSLTFLLHDLNHELQINEYSRGCISQFEFLHYFLPQSKLLKSLYFRMFYIVSFPFKFLNRLPGQYLVTVIRKKVFPDV